MSLQNALNEFAEMVFSDYQFPELIKPGQNIFVHRNNITSSLVRTLQDSYPLVVKLVGENFFRTTAENYILQYPSRSSNLHEYGEYFSDFLAEYPPAMNLIYLSEVAKFEWICHCIYFAADHSSMDMKLLQEVPPGQFEKIHFVLHPASRIVKFQYPILRIIELCNQTSSEPISVAEGGANLLIIRRDLDIMLVTLTSADYVFLNAIQDNYSLSIAVKAAMNIDPDFKLREKLLGWIEDKTIVDLTVSN